MDSFYEHWESIFTDLLAKEKLGIYTKEEWEQEYEGAEMDYKGRPIDYGKNYGAFLEHFYFRREQLAKVVGFWRKQVERGDWSTEELLLSNFQVNGILQRDFKESVFSYTLGSDSSEKCWLEAMARVFNPAMSNTLMESFETETTMPPKKLAKEVKSKKKKAPPPNVAIRRVLVNLFAKAYPQLKGKNLDLETCIDLDSRRVAIPAQWAKNYEVINFEEAYKLKQTKPLVEKMFSDDRKHPSLITYLQDSRLTSKSS